MFLFYSLAVFTIAYGLSALLAELVLTTPEERELPAAVRTALGFTLSVVYFSAAWQLMSIQQAWILGAVLAGLYAIAAWRRGAAENAPLKRMFRSHAKSYVGYLAGALLFFAPLLIANNYGPFTEGGGDVSIYADTAQYLTNKELTARGSPSEDLRDVVQNVKDALSIELDRHVLNRLAEDRYVTADRVLINPPVAENAIYRLLVLESMSPFLYAPYGEFYFLAGSHNYHVYFGIQAFVYAILLMTAWTFLRRFGTRPALAYLALIVSSHALISVFYNMYSAHAISLAVCALVLSLLPTVRLWSKAGARTYGMAAGYLWVGYVHFLSVVGPLILIALLHPSRARASATTPDPSPERWRKLVRAAVACAFLALFAILIISGVQKSAPFVYDLIVGRLSGEENTYMGDRITAFSFHWLAYLFGFISQQHLQPFAVEIPWVIHTIRLGVAVGIACLFLGYGVAARSRIENDTREWRYYLLMYAGILATVAFHIYLAQSYVYTQAKGAQNVLVALYGALVLPLALGLERARADERLRRLTRVLGVLLLVFIATLLVPRAVYTYKIARARDRASILEPSYFDEAAKIRARDPKPFVLFEPRKSADLYVSVQPFFGARMVPTRHLAMTRMNFDVRPPYGQRIDASRLMTPEDLPHLWMLSSVKDATGRSIWKAQRVADLHEPTLFLFGDDYEQNFGERPRSADPNDVGTFSYLRNGSAMLYLPVGQPGTLEVRLSPREAAGFDTMLQELRGRLVDREFAPSAKLQEDGKFITMTYEFGKHTAPAMVELTRFSGEYWLNVRLNGKEVVSKALLGAVGIGGTEKIAGVLVKEPSGTVALRASWAGIRTPNKEDWIGVFPVGGPDASRIAFVFLGAQKGGTVTIPLPAASVSQAIEVRLYRAGSWSPTVLSKVPAGIEPSPKAK